MHEKPLNKTSFIDNFWSWDKIDVSVAHLLQMIDWLNNPLVPKLFHDLLSK